METCISCLEGGGGLSQGVQSSEGGVLPCACPSTLKCWGERGGQQKCEGSSGGRQCEAGSCRGECVSPPTPLMRKPHVQRSAGRREESSCGTTRASVNLSCPARQAHLSTSDKAPCRGTTCASPAFPPSSDGDESAPLSGVSGHPPAATGRSVARRGEHLFYFAASSGHDSNKVIVPL